MTLQRVKQYFRLNPKATVTDLARDLNTTEYPKFKHLIAKLTLLELEELMIKKQWRLPTLEELDISLIKPQMTHIWIQKTEQGNLLDIKNNKILEANPQFKNNCIIIVK